MAKQEFWGKYLAYVRDVNDPYQKGRIRVQCPKVLGSSLTDWCEPCTPIGYDGGGDLAVPKLNDTVWIEFLEGDSKQPIYVGNTWSVGNSPLANHGYDVNKRILKWDNCEVTMEGETMILSVAGTSTITMTGSSMTLNVGGSTIAITPSSVTINSGNISLN